MTDTPEDIAAAEAEGWQADYDGENPKTAKEFLHDGSFFKKIDELKVENKQLKDSMNQLSGHYEKVVASERKKAEVEYERRINELKAAKVEALDEGDNKRVVDIDEEIRTTAKPQDEPIANESFETWVKDNSWYNDDPFLQIEADKYGDLYYSKGFRGRELYDAVGNHVKEAHQDKFTNAKRNKAPSVEGGSNLPTGTPKGKITEKDLEPNEREVFRNFKHMNIFKNKDDEQKYLRQVIEVR